MIRKTLVVLLGLFPFVAAAVTIDMVTVGDANNPADPLTGYGSVGYTYEIGKYEVMNSQYAEFLNSVAATDTYGLYNIGMASDPRGGIVRSGSDGSYTYSVKDNMGDKPVNYVSFYDAVRFANWLQNGQPAGAQGPGTTETGSYTVFTDGSNNTTNVSARTSSGWVIPTENEWYKAAYFQPSSAGGPADNYWLYPTQSDVAPAPGLADAAGNITNAGPNVVNYNSGADWNGQNGNVTTVGSAGPSSDSYYGTFDQGGNLYEWDETIINGSSRGWRGGDWLNNASPIQATTRNNNPPSAETGEIGFRLAIPEPPCVGAAVVAALGLCVCGRRCIRRG